MFAVAECLIEIFFTSNTTCLLLTENKCTTDLKEAIKSLHYGLKPNLKIQYLYCLNIFKGIKFNCPVIDYIEG